VKAHGTRYKVQGTRYKAHGTRYKVQGTRHKKGPSIKEEIRKQRKEGERGILFVGVKRSVSCDL